jgi:hypothetical protein
MLKLLLLSASLLSAQEVSMECANLTHVQTPAMRGPAGVAVALKISSADDHAKDTHDCMAEYELLVTPANGRAARIEKINISDAEWGRSLSGRLDGFSRDGKRVFGIITEGGKYAWSMVFAYDSASGNVDLVDLKDERQRLESTGCGTTFGVLGTTESQAIVVEPHTTDACRTRHRWLVDLKTGNFQELAAGSAIVPLVRGTSR